MKAVTAKTSLKVNAECPHCECFQDIYRADSYCYDEVREVFHHHGEPRADCCDIEVECVQCKQMFMVTDIEF